MEVSKIENKNEKTHDTIFKELLEDKEEFKDFIKEFVGFNLDGSNLEVQNKEFRTRLGLKTRYIDILYKIKKEETFILIEHQSTVDYTMSERMSDYCLVVIASRRKYMKKSKNRKAPVILPNVLNTAPKKWDATRTIKQEENNRYRIPALKYPEYNVIDINDYRIDELLEKRTGVALAMAFEKIREKEEIFYIINKLEERGINEREKRAMVLIIENLEDIIQRMIKNLTKEEIEEIKKAMKEIISKGSDFMTNFAKTFIRIYKEERVKGREEGRAEGKIEGKVEGKVEGIFQVAKEMIKNKVQDEDIMKYTHISKEELEELKLQIV